MGVRLDNHKTLALWEEEANQKGLRIKFMLAISDQEDDEGTSPVELFSRLHQDQLIHVLEQTLNTLKVEVMKESSASSNMNNPGKS